MQVSYISAVIQKNAISLIPVDLHNGRKFTCPSLEDPKFFPSSFHGHWQGNIPPRHSVIIFVLQMSEVSPKRNPTEWAKKNNERRGNFTTYIPTTNHPLRTSWWLNQPIWKICSSNWIISPGRGENKKMLPRWEYFLNDITMPPGISVEKVIGAKSLQVLTPLFPPGCQSWKKKDHEKHVS